MNKPATNRSTGYSSQKSSAKSSNIPMMHSLRLVIALLTYKELPSINKHLDTVCQIEVSLSRRFL
jgi:hypothetical protein